MCAPFDERQLGARKHEVLVPAKEADAVDYHADTERRGVADGGERRGRGPTGDDGRRAEERGSTAHRTSPTHRRGRPQPRWGCRARARSAGRAATVHRYV